MDPNAFEILLIEDDQDDAEFTIYTLKKNRLANRLLHIDNGEDALNFLYDPSNEAPKLILLDLRMPRVDGIQILRRLKNDEHKRSIPVLVMVSSMDGRSYVESFHVKADAYITKPIDFQKFFNAIAQLGLTWTILSTAEVDRISG